MNPLTLEWVAKAEGDYTAVVCLVASPTPVPDAVCFHAQQVVEKYLKACLQEAAVAFRRTHDLEERLALLLPAHPAWAAWEPDFLILTTHAVDFRYPGCSASADDAKLATRVCTDVRAAVRAALGIGP